MSTDLITIEELMQRLKMAKEGAKKQPGLMKSTPGFFQMVSTYVERIASAKDDGFWVATHGTQQPLEILEAMNVRGCFNEFWGAISDLSGKLESVPAALAISASTGTPGEVCSFFRNMDGLMHAGKWPRSDFFLYATSVCDNVKAFHTLGRRYGIPSYGLERSYHPYTAHAMEHWRERVQAVHRLPGGADGNEDGLRPSEGGRGPLLPPHRAPPGDRQAHRPCPVSVVTRMLRRHAASDPSVARHPAGHRLPRRSCATSSRSVWTRASAPSRTSASG